MNNLYCGIFSFLEILIKPLWGIVIIVFIAILFVISKTIIKEAKKRQKGMKPGMNRSDFYREIEPYSEMPYVRITFNGKEPEYIEAIEEEFDMEAAEEFTPKPKKKKAPKEEKVIKPEKSKKNNKKDKE